jgi:hypothetical protein
MSVRNYAPNLKAEDSRVCCSVTSSSTAEKSWTATIFRSYDREVVDHQIPFWSWHGNNEVGHDEISSPRWINNVQQKLKMKLLKHVPKKEKSPAEKETNVLRTATRFQSRVFTFAIFHKQLYVSPLTALLMSIAITCNELQKTLHNYKKKCYLLNNDSREKLIPTFLQTFKSTCLRQVSESRSEGLN